MNKLLVICGLTATGKTSLALHLGKVVNGEIVSADSRQVFKYMDIGTGKDIPDNFKFHTSNLKNGNFDISYYTNGNMRLWGYDLVDPKDEFSVAQYERIAKKIIRDIRKRKKLPIIVGGTGLYVKALVDGIETSGVPKDVELRISLEKKSAGELFKILSVKDPIKAANMNTSDSKNPRRLIRAIEVARSKSKIAYEKNIPERKKKTNSLFIGLTSSKKNISDKIELRVKNRLSRGIEKEINKLLSMGVKWSDQSMNTLGYKEWFNYFQGLEKKDKVLEKWIVDEKNYAKRQLTWFKKDKRIEWFDVDKKGWKKDVEKLVSEWHNNN